MAKARTDGHAYAYAARPDNPSIPLFKTFVLLQSLQPLLKRLRPQTHRIVLYGPCATGADAPGSDINLFIVAPNPTAVLNITDTWRMPVYAGSESRKVGRSESRKNTGAEPALGVPRGGTPASLSPTQSVLNLLSSTLSPPPSSPAEPLLSSQASSVERPASARRVVAIIMPPADEIPILTPDPEADILAIESGLLLWQDPARPAPHLTTRGGGRHKIAIVTNYLKWKKSADPHWASEPYVISMAFDSHTAGGETIEPFFNALPFPNVLAGDTLPMLGQGHFFYGPRDPGEFVALSVFWMEKDASARDLGQTISDLQSNKKIKSSIKALAAMAGEGLARLLPGLGAVAAITAEALKLNKDDEIFRSDGVYLREYDPPYDIGSDKVIGNVFLDFNIKVIGIGR